MKGFNSRLEATEITQLRVIDSNSKEFSEVDDSLIGPYDVIVEEMDENSSDEDDKRAQLEKLSPSKARTMATSYFSPSRKLISSKSTTIVGSII